MPSNIIKLIEQISDDIDHILGTEESLEFIIVEDVRNIKKTCSKILDLSYGFKGEVRGWRDVLETCDKNNIPVTGSLLTSLLHFLEKLYNE